MEHFVQNYLLTCQDPAKALEAIQDEALKIYSSNAVTEYAMSKGLDIDAVKSTHLNIGVQDAPAFSPGEFATLAITIVVLNPLGDVFKEAMSDIWTQIVFPRLCSWIEEQTWSIKKSTLVPQHAEGDNQMSDQNKLSVIDPSTGKLLTTIEMTRKEDVEKIVARAKTAQKSWKLTSPDERIALFGKLAELMGNAADELISLIGQEAGKRKSDAEYEVYDIIDGIEHYCRQLRLITSQDRVVPLSFLPHGTKFDTVPEIHLEPHGVAGVIMPWNFPFWIPMANLIPLLLAGNTAVFKPAEQTSLVGQRIKKLFDDAGFPEGVIELIIGAEDVGKALVESNIDMIVLTGGIEAGLDVKRKAMMRPVELELGGNSASIVCEDAPLNLAVEGVVWGALYNAGQSCSGHKRVYVHESVAQEFIAMVVEKVKSLKPLRDYGPYITPEAMKTVSDRVKDAVNKGAMLLIGGNPIKDLPNEYRNGNWYEPTVLVYANDNLPLVSLETFGNVLPIRIVKSEDEAIALANDTSYGLNNIVWTTDFEKGEKIARQLESGMVFINEAELALVAGEYWGGWKNSGLGTTGTKLERCFRQKLLITYTKTEPREYWFPYEK